MVRSLVLGPDLLCSGRTRWIRLKCSVDGIIFAVALIVYRM